MRALSTLTDEHGGLDPLHSFLERLAEGHIMGEGPLVVLQVIQPRLADQTLGVDKVAALHGLLHPANGRMR